MALRDFFMLVLTCVECEDTYKAPPDGLDEAEEDASDKGWTESKIGPLCPECS